MSLSAVILVGGQGTRLRPLTERIRKDMLPLVDRPLIAYTFEHLRRHGVRHGIVSCGFGDYLRGRNPDFDQHEPPEDGGVDPASVILVSLPR